MEAFQGTQRFALRGSLGSGSFGTVFEAEDQERGISVALKVPHEHRASALYRFKQEFRALAELAHPNLVVLHELFTEGGTWFFTMERVQGLDFATWLRMGDAGEVPAPADPTRSFYSPPQDYSRFRPALIQLIEGLDALHRAGLVHRDIKPTNVLVTPEGRVKILDFGLTANLDDRGSTAVGEAGAGTAAYLAPEQLEDRSTAASDFYSVGALLFEAFTGFPPYTGSLLEILQAKASLDPCPPSLLVKGIPEDLEQLCLDLLLRDPQARPGAAELLARLQAPAPEPAPEPLGGQIAVGREREMIALTDAFHRLEAGEGGLALLAGPSGMGKSYLLRRFQRELQRHPQALVLTGRCYEQESVPYKALDSVVDALAQHLKGLPEADLAELLPPGVAALGQVFPVLQELPGIGVETRVDRDRREQRRRAFDALRTLLGRLGESRDLVLIIDDLHWGDLDSLRLIRGLLEPPEPPRLLLLLCCREDERTDPEVRAALRALVNHHPGALHLVLGDLPPAEAQTLALALLGSTGLDNPELVARIARESGGNPFFLAELVRHTQRLGLGEAETSLEGYLRSRLDHLDAEARDLLNLLALAGEPLDWEILVRASGLGEGTAAVLARLRRQQLVRAQGERARLQLEPTHDRVRRAAEDLLEEAQRAPVHLRLAEALLQQGSAEPMALARHLKAAGQSQRARSYMLEAAERAEQALAFGRAADLFRETLALSSPEDPDRPRLLQALADALATAGRSVEAGRVYLEASAAVPRRSAPRLRRRAAEEFLRGGAMEEGLQTLRGVLAEAGFSYPASPARALLSLLLGRLRLKLRGLHVESRAPEAVSPDLLERVDTLWAAAMGLGPIDILRGADFQARQLWLTLKAGEPFRVVRALAHEMIFVAQTGSKAREAAARLQAETLALAERLDHPGPRCRAYIAAGIAATLQGRWRSAAELLAEAESLLKDQVQGMTYELHIASHHRLIAHSIMGHYQELERQLPGQLRAAEERGDFLASTDLKVSLSPLLTLAADQPDRAREELRETMARWPNRDFHTQHYHALSLGAQIELYAGDADAAWDMLQTRWPALRKSLLLEVQAIRITCLELRARTALALLPDTVGSRAKSLRQSALQDLKRLEREGVDYAEALVLKNRALLSLQDGKREEALGLFFRAEVAFEGCTMALHAQACRRVRGVLAGTGGLSLLQSAEGLMAAQGIRNPDRFTALHVPGIPGTT